jgi:Uma2 family endonuclease
MASITQDTPFYTVLHGISWEVYERIAKALSPYPNRHTYLDGTLEIRRLMGGVSWNSYLELLAATGDISFPHTYLNGELEIMSPLKDHDWVKRIMGRMIETMAGQLDIEIQSVGSMTVYNLESQGGLQPDEAYYIQNEAKVRCKKSFDPAIDPPPDLVFEIDVTNTCLNRLQAYGQLKVPEIWRYHGESLQFFVRSRTGKYNVVETSLAFPFLQSRDIERHINLWHEISENAVVKSFVSFAKKQHREYLRNQNH